MLDITLSLNTLAYDIFELSKGVISDDDSIVIYTDPSKFIEVKDALEKNGYNDFLVSEVTFVPNNYINLLLFYSLVFLYFSLILFQ